jgi:hypothetical protein
MTVSVSAVTLFPRVIAPTLGPCSTNVGLGRASLMHAQMWLSLKIDECLGRKPISLVTVSLDSELKCEYSSPFMRTSMILLELQLRDAGGFSIVSTDDAFHATAISCGVFIRVYFLLNRSIYNQFNESYSTAQRHFLQIQYRIVYW